MISKFHFFTEAILQKIQIKMGAVFLNVQLVVTVVPKSISLIHNTQKKKKSRLWYNGGIEANILEDLISEHETNICL